MAETTTHRPHVLNRGFTWVDHEAVDGRVLTAEQVAQYDEQGFVLLDRVLDEETVDLVLAEIDPVEAETEALLREAEGGRVFIARADEITFTTHLVRRSAFLRELVSSELLTGICADLVGPDVRLYWDQGVYKKPGTADPFPWHQDNGYAYVEPQQYLTCWIALTDTDETNGCPLVVPGVHREGTLAHRSSDIGYVCLDDPPGVVAVPARAGSIVVFSSLTPHCTGPHSGGPDAGVRKAYIVQYAPDGAVVARPDGRGGWTRTPADDPERQFPVLVGGQRTAPPPLATAT